MSLIALLVVPLVPVDVRVSVYRVDVAVAGSASFLSPLHATAAGNPLTLGAIETEHFLANRTSVLTDTAPPASPNATGSVANLAT